METENNDPTRLGYAARKSRSALWVDLFVGVVGVTVVFPLAGIIAYQASRTARGHYAFILLILVVALAGFGFGIWCVRTAIRGWRRRNLAEPPLPPRVQSLRWRWILPGIWVVLLLFQIGSMSGPELHRGWYIFVAILWIATFFQELYLHLWVVRAEKRPQQPPNANRSVDQTDAGL